MSVSTDKNQKDAPFGPEALKPHIHQLLREWYQPAAAEQLFLDRLLLTAQLEKDGRDSPEPARTPARQMLLTFLDQLAARDERGGALLRARFLEQKTVREVAQQLALSVDRTNRLQQQALSHLAALIATAEDDLRAAHRQRIKGMMPAAAYHILFGRDEVVQKLAAWLTAAEQLPVVVLTGLGGIGKTAVAHAAAQLVMQEMTFDHIIWIRLEAGSMEGQYLDAHQLWAHCQAQLVTILEKVTQTSAGASAEAWLAQQLHEQQFLVVIDNIEDQEHTELIARTMWRWASPSRFLLTSRAQPQDETAAAVLSLPALSRADSFAFIRDEAERRELPGLATATAAQLDELVAITGGHPLALKLVIGLAAAVPLPAVLADLQRDRPGPTEQMYRNIYFRTWRALTEEARTLLVGMPLVGEVGAEPAQMMSMSGLPEPRFWQAVRELVSRSLLEARGSVWERRYGIHRLTESFLNTEINRWDDDE